MKRDTTQIGLYVLAVLSFGGTALLYPSLPPLFPVHWSANGVPDGWADKSWAAFMLPSCTLIPVVIRSIWPALVRSGRAAAWGAGAVGYCMVIVAGMFAALQAFALHTALRPDSPVDPRLFLSCLFVCLALIGNVLGQLPPNPLCGIRTPWTLASESVWIATHRLGARLVTGVASLCTVLVWLGVPAELCAGAVVAALLAPAVASYYLYHRSGPAK
jgi:uncharacterized membrane protein